MVRKQEEEIFSEVLELGIKKNKDKNFKDNEISEALEKTLKILQSG